MFGLAPSTAVLVTANTVPILAALFMGWEVFDVMLLFWLENIVIGMFNVLKMITAQSVDVRERAARFVLAPFFALHYGLFTAGHGLFVFTLFGQGQVKITGMFDIGGLVGIVHERGLYLALVALVLSHGFSFFANYLKGGEYRTVSLKTLMHQPYRRIMLLHLTIIFGGFPILLLGSPIGGLLLLIGLKIVMDVRAHDKEHKFTLFQSG